jgi:alkylation response protein AidB-like acyl-CoA dehydrogenase
LTQPSGAARRRTSSPFSEEQLVETPGDIIARDLDAYRAAFREWLDEHESLLAPQRTVHSHDFSEVTRRQRAFQVALFDDGWVRYGWPESIGGLGGDARHRGSLYDALVARGVPVPEAYYTLETLVPMLAVYAPALAREHLDALLRGDEAWCQGFSEPDAGSDLASLRTKATRDGDGWVINGHKIWTSQVSVAQRCVALVRTGTPESRHRGLSMFLVDLDAPGVTTRPIRALSGRDEFGEVFFDDVQVGDDRLIGDEGDGWGVAMYLLQWERGMYPWQRQAALLTVLDRVLADHAERVDPGELADSYVAILPMRLSARNTIHRLVAGENPGPEVSVDKVLLARAEVLVHDLADAALLPAIELGDDGDAQAWRHDYLFSRAAPIYGGSIEIQRTILADRVLGLPR